MFHVMDSDLVKRLEGPLRKKYSGDHEYTLLMRDLTRSVGEPSFRVVSPDELKEEIDVLGETVGLNGFRYRGINEEFLKILQTVASDYRWERKPYPSGISDVDKHILMCIRKISE